MSAFGDAEPEDAWDPDDPLPELIENLLRRIALLVVLRELGERAQQRLELIETDLRHVVARARAEIG
jgi:hypothetical protein